MDNYSNQSLRFCTTAHFFALVGVYFSSIYNNMFLVKRMKNFPIALLFLFANMFVNRFYSKYFLIRSFEIKYKDIDDQSLEKIIKSLEASKLIVH